MVDLPTPFPPVTIIIVVVSEMENKEKFHLNFHFRFHLNFHHEEYLCLCWISEIITQVKVKEAYQFPHFTEKSDLPLSKIQSMLMLYMDN